MLHESPAGPLPQMIGPSYARTPPAKELFASATSPPRPYTPAKKRLPSPELDEDDDDNESSPVTGSTEPKLDSDTVDASSPLTGSTHPELDESSPVTGSTHPELDESSPLTGSTHLELDESSPLTGSTHLELDESSPLTGSTHPELTMTDSCEGEVDDFYWYPKRENGFRRNAKWRRYFREVRESDGFDITPFKAGSPLFSVVPGTYYLKDPDFANRMKGYVHEALGMYNTKYGTSWSFQKIHKLNRGGCCHSVYYITFSAADANEENVKFQAKVVRHRNGRLKFPLIRHRPRGKRTSPTLRLSKRLSMLGKKCD